MRVIVIDGQGGRLGQLFIAEIRKRALPCHITAIGTNAIATAAMLKAGADEGATGENPVLVACRTADVIVCPIAMLVADAMLGEVTPVMAMAVGQSKAVRILMPVNKHCCNVVVGLPPLSMSEVALQAADYLVRHYAEIENA